MSKTSNCPIAQLPNTESDRQTVISIGLKNPSKKHIKCYDFKETGAGSLSCQFADWKNSELFQS